MKNLVLCVTLNFLFFINIVYSEVQVAPVDKSINFTPKQSFKLTCNVTYEGDDPPNVEWNKDGKAVTSIDGLKNRAKAKWENKLNILTIGEAIDDDAGDYSCVIQDGKDGPQVRAELVASRSIAVKVPTNINVVEEEKLRIECKVVGNPKLKWIFDNDTYMESRDRVVLSNYTDDGKVIENGIFIIEKITKEDRGVISCVGQDIYSNKTVQGDCMIRIKDKYAALWPFLGICAEVIVLCAIIIIYEKKRNKSELDESDTDQSPDQKNTPDHGKEANLRHRQ